MAIIDYNNDIHRDTDVLAPNVYIGNGQGCGTVWFFTSADALEAIKNNDGLIPDGHQANICAQCACRYSALDKNQKDKPFFACKPWKEHFTNFRKLPKKE